MSETNQGKAELNIVGKDFTFVENTLWDWSIQLQDTNKTTLSAIHSLFGEIEGNRILSHIKDKGDGPIYIEREYRRFLNKVEKTLSKKNLFSGDVEGKLLDEKENLLKCFRENEEIRSELVELYSFQENKSDSSNKKVVPNEEDLFLLLVDYAEEYRRVRSQLVSFYENFVNSLDPDKIKKIGRRNLESEEKDKYTICDSLDGKITFGDSVGSIRKVMDFNEWKKCLNPLENTSVKNPRIVVSVEIRSRFDVLEKDQNGDVSFTAPPYFLLTMLTRGNLVMNSYSVQENEESIFDCLLLWKLRVHLLHAYQKGAYRTYQRFEANNERMKGAIDFSKHIKYNLGMNNGKVAYSYREKTVDNYLNHLILEAYYHLKKKYPDLVANNLDTDNEIAGILQLLKNETSYPKYGKRSLLLKCEAPISHPYYSEYEELRQTCCAILRDEGFSIFGGTGDEVQGILYYIPDLWEEYLESVMFGMNVDGQAEIPIFNKSFPSRPDFVLYEKSDNYMILDAKFKPAWLAAHRSGKLGALSDDYDKCIRDMNSISAFATGVIFPYSNGSTEILRLPKTQEIREDSRCRFYTIPVGIPKIQMAQADSNEEYQTEAESYEVWKDRLNKNIEVFLKELTSIQNVERDYYFCQKSIDETLGLIKDGSGNETEEINHLREALKRMDCLNLDRVRSGKQKEIM